MTEQDIKNYIAACGGSFSLALQGASALHGGPNCRDWRVLEERIQAARLVVPADERDY